MENEKIIALQEGGLNKEESLVYLVLMKYGEKGATVRKINSELYEIGRTSIYSILQKLINKEFVIEKITSETPKKAKLFIALEPKKFFIQTLAQKKEQLKNFEKKEQIFMEDFQNLYESEGGYTIDKIDPFIQPFIQPLIEKKWKISKQIVEKSLNLFGYDLYQYHIDPPETTSLKGYSGFNAYVFDHVIALNQALMFQHFDVELKFILMQIKRSIINRFSNEFRIANIKINESEISLYGRKFPSLIVEIKSENMKKYSEAFKSVILTIENKVFFIWAVKPNAVEEMLKSIIQVENNSYR